MAARGGSEARVAGPRRVAPRSTMRYTVPVQRSITQRELRNENARIIDAVTAGDSFVVTRHGVPVAELRPLPSGRRRLVPRSELAALAANSPHIDRARFEADVDASIDRYL